MPFNPLNGNYDPIIRFGTPVCRMRMGRPISQIGPQNWLP